MKGDPKDLIINPFVNAIKDIQSDDSPLKDKPRNYLTLRELKYFIQLDDVLKYVLNSTDLPVPEDKIRTELKLEIRDSLEILHKLEKDGYIRQDGNNRYRGTFEGRFFLTSNRGYIQKAYDEDREREAIETDLALRKKNDRRLLRYTLFAGIAASAVVVWEVIKYFYYEGHSICK